MAADDKRLSDAEVQKLARSWYRERAEAVKSYLSDRRPEDAEQDARQMQLAERRVDGLTELLKLNDIGSTVEIVGDLLAQAGGGDADFRRADHRQLGRLVLRAEKAAAELLSLGLQGRDGQVASDSFFAGQGSAMPLQDVPASRASVTGPLLSTRLEAAVKALSAGDDGWKRQTTAQNSATYRLFVELLGDRPPAAYTRQDIAEFQSLIQRMPALWGKSAAHRKMTARQVIEEAGTTGAKTISTKTLRRHMSAMGALFSYFQSSGDYPKDQPNPAHGQRPRRGNKATKARSIWEGDELIRLFDSPIWKGRTRAHRTRSGPKIVEDAQFWLPILGLYQPHRLEELAQLRREDVREVDGVWVFDINDEDGRQLKNDQSERVIPIHPYVIGLGFLEYVKRVTSSPSDNVFPDLRPSGPDGKLGAYFTKRFTAYRKAIGVYRQRLDFHSLRHSGTTQLAAKGVSDANLDDIVGHKGEGETRRTYVKKGRVPLPTLRDRIALLRWPEVEDILEAAVKLPRW